MLREAWALAIEALSQIELNRISERTALTQAAKQLRIRDPKILGLAHKLVLETSRRKNLTDYLINRALMSRALDDFRLGLRAFLRLYTYETSIRQGGVERAEKITRTGRAILGWRELRKVEGTLERLLYTNVDVVLKRKSDEERVALQTYHPTWFVRYCYRLLGRAEALEFLKYSNQIPSTYIRLNTLKAPTEALLDAIRKDGVTLKKEAKLMHTYKVTKSQKALPKMQSFRNGFFYIQDKASCLAAEVANPQPGMKVIDACAAPGAKTTYLAQLMKNKGTILSLDYSKRRMRVWKQDIKRLGTENAFPALTDLRKSLPTKLLANLVVLDPPCTSTGTFSRMPSGKWRLTKRSIMNMARIQWEMLNLCSSFVDDDGHLVYSTCSITVEENEMLIERFLKHNSEFTPVESLPRIGVSGLRGQVHSQRLYPHLHNCNGFFVAKLLKQTT